MTLQSILLAILSWTGAQITIIRRRGHVSRDVVGDVGEQAVKGVAELMVEGLDFLIAQERGSSPVGLEKLPQLTTTGWMNLSPILT